VLVFVYFLCSAMRGEIMRQIVEALLDFQFSKMVTPRLAPVVYLIAIAMSALFSFGMMFRMGFWGFLVGTVSFAASVVMWRVMIEVALSVFQIAKYTQETARQGRVAPPPPPQRDPDSVRA
jgi:hypothetical protein